MLFHPFSFFPHKATSLSFRLFPLSLPLSQLLFIFHLIFSFPSFPFKTTLLSSPSPSSSPSFPLSPSLSLSLYHSPSRHKAHEAKRITQPSLKRFKGLHKNRSQKLKVPQRFFSVFVIRLNSPSSQPTHPQQQQQQQ